MTGLLSPARAMSTVAVVLLAQAPVARAQGYDPATQSPTVLMAGPADGVDYFRFRNRARTLINQQKPRDAEPLALQLVHDYPRDGQNWLVLALAERALGKHAQSADAWERAGERLGWGISVNARFAAAGERLAAGDRARALELIRQEIEEGRSLFRQAIWDWPEFASLRGDPGFRRLTGHPDRAGWTRTEGWRHDVDYLYQELQRVAPDYRGRALPAEVTRRYQALRRDVPSLSDERIVIGLGRMLAPMHTGHTTILSYPRDRWLPLRIYAFPEGIFVTHGDGAAARLAGSRVVEIGGLPAEEVLRRLSEARSVDGDMEYLWYASDLASAYHLVGVGAATRTDSVRLSLERPGGARETVTLATVPPPSGRQDRLIAPTGVAAPLFLRDVDRPFWAQPLPEHDALYVQVNNLVDDSTETLGAFGRRLYGVLGESKPKAIVLDLRHNNGGVTGLYPDLLRTIVAYQRDPAHRLYVLIGRRSYSATANFITDLERLARPLFVGEASSECCNIHGDASHVVLPYSGVEAELSAVRWNLSRNVFDARREISPDVPVQLTARAYFAGTDPALEAVFRLLDER